MITLDSLTQNTVLSIGKQLENNSTDFIFNAETWLNQFPDGIIALLIRRAEEEDFYVANTGINFVNKTVSWMITSYDTEIPGYNLAEFQLISDGAVRKSATFKIYVTTSLYPGQAPHETPAPQWVEDYLSEFTALHSGTVQAQEVASIAADRAEEARERAQEEADRAKDEADRAESAATGSIEQAEEAAERAAESAQQAQDQATIATNQANRANNYANYANNYANNSSRSASSANTQANRAETYATQASSAASSAYQSASLAETAVTNATAQADRAKDEADRAKDEADRAETAADNCENKAPSIEETEGPAAVATFLDGANNFPLRVQVQIEPVQAGSGDPSPDNVRPISGWTGCTINHAGDDALTDVTFESGYYNDKGVKYASDYLTRTVDYIPVASGSVCKLIVNASNSGRVIRVHEYDKNQNWLRQLAVSEAITAGITAELTFTISQDARYIRFSCPKYNWAKLYTNVRTYQIDFPAETGTVYGGTLTINKDGSGVIKSRPYYAAYNGEQLIGPWISSMDTYTEGATPTNGAQVVDMGGAETTEALTPGQIKTLLGTNNVWSDAGLITVQYTADTKLYIEKYIASIGG